MGSKVLLVIDMLNDFCKPGGALYFKEAEEIIPNVKELIERFLELENKDSLFFLCDSHTPDDLEFKKFPKHCVTDTWGAGITAELAEYAKDSNIIRKRRYSGFFDTELETKLFHKGDSAHKLCVGRDESRMPSGLLLTDEVWVCGVCTHICVLFTVEELCNRDIRVKVFKETVASFDPKFHEFALQLMEKVLGVEII